jgi:3-phenylpropionate/trans-cinnamate dioxygenase ferredoxin reductase subunit
MKHFDVIIIGAGHAGGQCAISLRQNGFEGSIAMIGDEPDPPYERPPLSKDYLSGDKSFERLHLRPPHFWPERQIELLLGQAVDTVSSDEHVIVLNDGARLGYGALVWAAGGEPRRLSCEGHDLAGLHYIRRRADVDRLKEELTSTERVVVIGGGYIGLEAAAVMTKFGKRVTVVELQDRVLARVAGEPLSRFFEQEHRAHGVDIRLGVAVERIEGRDGRVSGVRLATGETLPADIAIVGVGIIPNIAPLIAAGAQNGNGVLVDDECRTSLPDIFAIGDCAAHANAFAPTPAPIRLESVQNANDQAEVVGRILSGKPATYHATPWFWSNQYDIRLQTIGLLIGYDEIVVRGAIADKRFALVYLRQGKVIALDCVNSAKDFVQGRALVEKGSAPSPAALADPDVPLKSLLDASPT